MCIIIQYNNAKAITKSDETMCVCIINYIQRALTVSVISKVVQRLSLSQMRLYMCL